MRCLLHRNCKKAEQARIPLQSNFQMIKVFVYTSEIFSGKLGKWLRKKRNIGCCDTLIFRWGFINLLWDASNFMLM